MLSQLDAGKASLLGPSKYYKLKGGGGSVSLASSLCHFRHWHVCHSYCRLVVCSFDCRAALGHHPRAGILPQDQLVAASSE